MILVLMGVCGCGKSTVGDALAQTLGWPFYDADDFHPAANVAKMAAGEPLTDADRWPWLDGMAAQLKEIEARNGHAVLACSALREVYRERLTPAGDVRIVYLQGNASTIAQRLAARQHHFMPATLLASQFAALEEPVDAFAVDIRLPITAQVKAICERFGLTQRTRA